MDLKDAVKALGALAQESRLTVFRMLVEAGPEGMSPGVIGERTGIPPATLSFHLKELANAGLVSSRPRAASFCTRRASTRWRRCSPS